MSLIERVADKLGSVSVGQQRKPAAALETADAALPAAVIERASSRVGRLPDLPEIGDPLPEVDRSEERRVGKECRSRWSPYH